MATPSSTGDHACGPAIWPTTMSHQRDQFTNPEEGSTFKYFKLTSNIKNVLSTYNELYTSIIHVENKVFDTVDVYWVMHTFGNELV